MRILTIATVALALIATAQPKAAKIKPVKLPKGAGQAIVQAKCSGCHLLNIAVSKRQDADQWAISVDQMISRGATVTDAEYDPLVDYLAKNFGPKK